ncbi:amino acid dehydrogenase [Phyllobacterium brassicacearum]|uniref:Amino acid dehydrogenase n=1 Tax=Phyllobacterium brassicacearum TaxID=314235 RepID=A0A2P7BD13_9HYPH|nr:FAD-binding oxidoreductase [Phyllobacterium brassicacearum]PSH64329.1 amino acid dehydrogenase [Phyllobacterium brassicacearum]TDQ21247.1 glycine/D-amino acid oxidase-like deaminating enzyme [Phyllobacterium brassicacearum]
MNTQADHQDIAIVGAGIIGIAIAACLSESGRKVLVVDRQGICEGTSSGNAGALAFSDILPLASKGILAKVPGWLMDPLGPFTIRPSYLPKLTPWLYRFWRASRADMLERTIEAQGAMMRLAEPEMLGLMQRAGIRDMIREDGSLELYESEEELNAALPGWTARRRAGIAFEHLRGEQLAACQPGLAPRFVAGTFVPGWKTVSDPQQVGKRLWNYAERLGARFVRARVDLVAAGENGATAHLCDGRTIKASKLIVAAGAWSHRLAKGLGDTIPLETERGYNTTLPAGAFDLKRQLIFSGHGFVVTPLETGVRIGGAVELGGLDLPPNYRRSEAMLIKAQKFMPGLETAAGRQWMGYRPSLPDSLPAIGYAGTSKSVLYAFGHGHLGLTQAAATGRLITDLVSGKEPAISIEPFNPHRF